MTHAPSTTAIDVMSEIDTDDDRIGRSDHSFVMAPESLFWSLRVGRTSYRFL